MLRAIQDGILDGNFTSYLPLDIVRVYASGCNNSTPYNRETMDSWSHFGVIGGKGYIFFRDIREKASH